MEDSDNKSAPAHKTTLENSDMYVVSVQYLFGRVVAEDVWYMASMYVTCI